MDWGFDANPISKKIYNQKERDKSINLSKYDAKNERRNGQKRTTKLTEN